MAHVCKGNAGIIVQNGTDVQLSHVNISHVVQNGAEGKGNVAYRTSHPLQTKPHGYGGVTSRGIAIVTSENVRISDSQIEHVVSKTADTLGLDLLGINDNVLTSRLRVTRLRPAMSDAGGPTPAAIGCPIRHSHRTTETHHLNHPPPVLHGDHLA